MAAPTYGDRVQETFTTTGTGTVSLGGAVTGYQAFSAVVANAGVCYYTMTDGTNWEVGIGTYTTAGNTLARTKILSSSNAGAAVSWAAGTKSVWLDFPAAMAVAPMTNQFRLSLTTGVAVTTADVTGATSIFMVPDSGNNVSLFNGTTWQNFALAQLTLALGTLTNALPYDVFLDYNSGSPQLALLAWTSASARATALAYQDGVYVKSGTPTQRYLGTFVTTSTTTTEDSRAKRYLWNYYNRAIRGMSAADATATWTYSVASYRQANANTANQLNFVTGVAEDSLVVAAGPVQAANSAATVQQVFVGVGINSTTVDSSNVHGSASIFNAYQSPANAAYNGVPPAGLNFAAWLEKGAGSNTQTWTSNGAGINGSYPM